MEFTQFASFFDEPKQLTQRFCEVQAIILAHHSTYDIHPLMQRDSNTGKDKPKFLLPFGNQPIITYPLRLLEIHGFNEILVVITEEFEEEMTNFLNEYKYYEGSDENYVKPNITPIVVDEEDLGEIEVLKQIHKDIKTDFLMIRCDIVTNVPLRELIHIHRRENASITLLLSQKKQQKQTQDARKHPPPPRKKKQDKNTYIIGTDRHFHKELVRKGHPKEIERLWFMKARADLEDEDESMDRANKHDEPQLVLKKALLDYIPNIRFSTKFKLEQVGIFCRWILMWILEDAPKEYELLYQEAVPHLIDMQAEINTEAEQLQAAEMQPEPKSADANSQKFDFPGLMRRSSNSKVDEHANNAPVQPAAVAAKMGKLKKSSSHYASGLFLSHGNDVLGNDYMKVANASNSSLPRALIMKNMSSWQSDSNLKAFVDDSKSDITNVSMSRLSTAVNAPITPRGTVGNTPIKPDSDLDSNLNVNLPIKKHSPLLSQRVNSLPSPSHLASTADDLLPTQSFLVRDKSEFLHEENADKLKIFGYIYEEDNDHGLFSCIVNNSDRFLNLSMNLINSMDDFTARQQQEQHRQSPKHVKQQKQGKNKGKGKNARQKGGHHQQHRHHRRVDRNEEREELERRCEFERNALLDLVKRNNAMIECRENNPSANIKDGCVISANCIVGEKTILNKCVLQPFVNIGKNCKIMNCVIFKHVTIGDNCKISNTVISSYTNIGDKCMIHNCKIADRANIVKASTFKNETLQSGTLNDFEMSHSDDEDEDGNEENDMEEEDGGNAKNHFSALAKSKHDDTNIVIVD